METAVEFIDEQDDPIKQSEQPEFFCTNCGAEISEAENEDHAYLCDRCASY